jgi:hypothetical protein
MAFRLSPRGELTDQARVVFAGADFDRHEAAARQPHAVTGEWWNVQMMPAAKWTK